MENANQLDGFRNDVRGWVQDNFPASLAGVDVAGLAGGASGAKVSDAI